MNNNLIDWRRTEKRFSAHSVEMTISCVAISGPPAHASHDGDRVSGKGKKRCAILCIRIYYYNRINRTCARGINATRGMASGPTEGGKRFANYAIRSWPKPRVCFNVEFVFPTKVPRDLKHVCKNHNKKKTRHN